MNILGISCFYHDSAACLVRDGKIAGAVQEERFSRRKHDADFPLCAAEWCLRAAGLNAADLDYLVFYEKPFLKFERILENHLLNAPRGVRQFTRFASSWLKQKIWISDLAERLLDYHGKILFSPHHESHAASSFFPSPFNEAAFLTIDGVGEWETASLGIGSGSSLRTLKAMDFPHSLGLFYSAFTYYAGFKVNSGEYKLMGLAPYGEPRYKKLILDNLVDLKADGSFRLNMNYFGYTYGLKMINTGFESLFGAPPRKPETPIKRFYADIASSAQQVAEEVILRMARYARQATGQVNLCLGGGVALNCAANGRILKEGIFERLWIQPASGDAGGALGAALSVWHRYLNNGRIADGRHDCQKLSLLGPSYSDPEIENFLKINKINYKRIPPCDIAKTAADLVAEGKVVAWFQGALEFGPRALGARSIIADPRDRNMKSRLNLKVKRRENFRPFAPVVLREYLADWFEPEADSPYMTMNFLLKEEKRMHPQNLIPGDLLKEAEEPLSAVPAVTHLDYSSRVQTVNKEDNGIYYEMVKSFYDKTGCPMVINTSFNIRGEPLVCSPADAVKCFFSTDIDCLLIGGFLLDKSGA